MEYVIRAFETEDLRELALLAERLNASRETASSFCCTKAEDIERDFSKTAEYGSACFCGGRAVGLLACFLDKEKNNADCSLMASLSGEAYQDVAGRLLRSAREKLGPGVACTFFFPKENQECGRFLEQAGAKRQINEYILLLRRENWKKPMILAACPQPLCEGQQEAFATLHDTIFPDVYCSGKDILRDLGTTRFVYVIPDEAGLAAYGVLKPNGGGRACVEIVGVRSDMRRRGLGRAMLHYLAGQAFLQFGACFLELVVDADNRNALALYLDTGFEVWQENNCYILK